MHVVANGSPLLRAALDSAGVLVLVWGGLLTLPALRRTALTYISEEMRRRARVVVADCRGAALAALSDADVASLMGGPPAGLAGHQAAFVVPELDVARFSAAAMNAALQGRHRVVVRAPDQAHAWAQVMLRSAARPPAPQPAR